MFAIEFSKPIEDAIGDFLAFVPKLIGFLLVLVVGWFIAKWIRRIIVTLLKKIRFDEYIDKSGLGAPLERAGFADSGRFLAMIIYYLIMLLVLQLSLDVFGDNAISEALNGMIEFIPKLIVAIIIVILTGLVANAVRNMIGPALAEQTHGNILTNLAVAAIWFIGVFAALDQIEFAEDIVDFLFQAIITSTVAIMVIKFGVGGIWAARDRFWPAVYDRISSVDD